MPSGLIGVGTKIDPTLTRADRLLGQARAQTPTRSATHVISLDATWAGEIQPGALACSGVDLDLLDSESILYGALGPLACSGTGGARSCVGAMPPCTRQDRPSPPRAHLIGDGDRVGYDSSYE